jgi:hypothetical protein
VETEPPLQHQFVKELEHRLEPLGEDSGAYPARRAELVWN